MRKFFYLFLTLCCILLVIEVSGKFYFNADYINNKIITSLEKDNNIKVNVAGDTSFSLFYSPHVTFSNISLSSATNSEILANIDNIIVSINLSSLIKGKIEFDKLTVNSGEFKIHENKNFLFVSNIESILKYGFDSVLLKNCKISFGSGNNTIHLSKINTNINSTDKKITVNSVFKIQNNSIKSKVSFNREDYTSEVMFKCGQSEITIKGNFLANEKNFKGEITSKIANIAMLKDVVELIFPSSNFLDGLELRKNIMLTADINFLNGKVHVSQLVFKNDEISGDGNINIGVDNDVNIEILFSKIDYDALFTKSNDNYQSNVDFDLIPKRKNNVKASINITEFLFANKMIKNIVLDFAINNDHIEINQFKALFPDQLVLNVSDVKQVEEEGSKHLSGILMLQSENINKNLEWLGLNKMIVFNKEDSQLQITSNLLMSKSAIVLNDIKINLNSQQVVSGEYKIHMQDGNKKHSQGNLNINNMNFNDIYLPILATNIKNLIENSNENTYLSDFKIIRDISEKIDLDISIKNSTLDEKQINKLYASIILQDSSLDISNVKIDADFLKLDTGKLVIGAGSITPVLALQIIGDYLDISFFSSLSNSSASADDQLLNLFRFDVFEGYIYASLKKISLENKIFHKIIIDTKLADDKMLINNIQGHLSDNYFNIKGSYSFSKNIPIFSIGYAVNIVDINHFLSKVFAIDKIASGTLEGSGSAVTYGKYKKDLIANLEMNSSFTGKDIIVKGADIKNIINLSAKITSPGDMSVANYVDYNLHNGQTTINKISGDVEAGNGVIKMNNVIFNSYYSNGAISMSMNLPSMLYNMISVLTFVPVSGVDPIDIKLQSSGTIDKNETKFDTKELLNYLGSVYNK